MMTHALVQCIKHTSSGRIAEDCMSSNGTPHFLTYLTWVHLSICGTSGSWCAVHASFRGICSTCVQCLWLSVCWQEKHAVEKYGALSVLTDNSNILSTL